MAHPVGNPPLFPRRNRNFEEIRRTVGSYTAKSPLRRRWSISWRFRSSDIRIGFSQNRAYKSAWPIWSCARPSFSSETATPNNFRRSRRFRRKLPLTPRWGPRMRVPWKYAVGPTQRGARIRKKEQSGTESISHRRRMGGYRTPSRIGGIVKLWHPRANPP